MNDINPVQLFAVAALPVLFAITVHEVAHGWVARRLGDPTAMMLGRLTLNPVKHIDPIGTVLVPIMLALSGGFIFGWAKPVPITARNLRHPDKDLAWVAAAGPVSNVVMALLWAGVAKFAYAYGSHFPSFFEPLVLMAEIGIMVNLFLAILNMLPIPPLDGSKVLSAFLPGPWAYQMSRFEMYGLIFVAVLIFTGILGELMMPPYMLLKSFIYSLFGL